MEAHTLTLFGFCDFHRSGLFLLLAKSLRWVAVESFLADVVFLSSFHSFSFLLLLFLFLFVLSYFFFLYSCSLFLVLLGFGVSLSASRFVCFLRDFFPFPFFFWGGGGGGSFGRSSYCL